MADPTPTTPNLQPTCFVHIGAPKTGTTFLQRVMAANAPELARQGLLYPSSILRGYGHHDLAFLLNGGYPDWAKPQFQPLSELVAALKAELAVHSGSVLLSSENFYLFPRPQKLRALLGELGLLASHDIRLVAYVRRQDQAHESWYNQTIKAQGYTHDLAACIAAFDDLWDYRAQLESWAAVFGRGAIVVRPYEQKQFRGGALLTDFAAVLGIDPAQIVADRTPVNTGLNRDLLHFQRLLNHLPLPAERKRAFHKSLIELSLNTAGSGIFDESPLLSATETSDILARYREGNLAVAEMYLKQRDLFLEPARPDTGPQGGKGLSVEKLTMIMGWLLLHSRGEAK